jgi:hypothetical protein
MRKNFKIFLWLLKLGALVNLYFLVKTLTPPLVSTDINVLIPAQILFAVSTYRCLFPVRYKGNIVFHDSPLSSIFVTRLLATFSEVALIYQLSYVIRLLNIDNVFWVDVLSWVMVAQVIVSQFFVWSSILTGRLKLFFFEELGWAFIYLVNTIVSAYLYLTVEDFGGRELLIWLNLLFGLVYLPWQFFHLRALLSNAQGKEREEAGPPDVTWNILQKGLHQSIYMKNQTNEAKAWGGFIGITWMAAYWATLIPMWVYLIVLQV